jgi:hypothetical protein
MGFYFSLSGVRNKGLGKRPVELFEVLELEFVQELALVEIEDDLSLLADFLLD